MLGHRITRTICFNHARPHEDDAARKASDSMQRYAMIRALNDDAMSNRTPILPDVNYHAWETREARDARLALTWKGCEPFTPQAPESSASLRDNVAHGISSVGTAGHTAGGWMGLALQGLLAPLIGFPPEDPATTHQKEAPPASKPHRVLRHVFWEKGVVTVALELTMTVLEHTLSAAAALTTGVLMALPCALWGIYRGIRDRSAAAGLHSAMHGMRTGLEASVGVAGVTSCGFSFMTLGLPIILAREIRDVVAYLCICVGHALGLLLGLVVGPLWGGAISLHGAAQNWERPQLPRWPRARSSQPPVPVSQAWAGSTELTPEERVRLAELLPAPVLAQIAQMYPPASRRSPPLFNGHLSDV